MPPGAVILLDLIREEGKPRLRGCVCEIRMLDPASSFFVREGALAGDDCIIGGVGKDYINGGLGSDTASYANTAVGVTASLAAPSTKTNDGYDDRYISIENLTGSQFADVLTGTWQLPQRPQRKRSDWWRRQ